MKKYYVYTEYYGCDYTTKNFKDFGNNYQAAKEYAKKAKVDKEEVLFIEGRELNTEGPELYTEQGSKKECACKGPCMCWTR